ncbi:hypothetical protein [Actinocorallia sp. A-T 12471]|uniref:hypothetical protein n=1 Tax=Actinocorallia sp. A-T 12471 TaxID=3089813 RepID=UPI0029CE44E6|nr:hypothetical protein [Actinocorallia sp. A-T 12471]MDX6741600.1 hypothetical protein [Actinocorallia sp. A-T 12471]
MDMSVIGISVEEEEVYRFFLRHPGEGIGTVRQALGWDPDAIEAAVEALGRLALLEISDRHRIAVTEPRIGVERLIERRLHDLNGQIRQVLAARDAISSLVEDQRQGEAKEPTLDIERINGLDRVRLRLDDLAFFSYRETLAVHPGGPLSRAAIDKALPLDTRSLRRGLVLRCVYHPGALEDAPMAAYVREISGLGAEIRVTSEPLDRMVIFDRGAAVVPVNPRDSKQGALLVREPGLVAQMVAYFDTIWQSADVLDAGPGDGGPLLSDMDRKVLAALCDADKDEIAARDLNVSVRTYRRYVADLMTRLGAVNRFQAALRAREANWI